MSIMWALDWFSYISRVFRQIRWSCCSVFIAVEFHMYSIESHPLSWLELLIINKQILHVQVTDQIRNSFIQYKTIKSFCYNILSK